jgi:two-component system response regulator (stage 0 sporulation protein A)
MNQEKIKVLIADSNKEYCDTARDYLNNQADIEVIGVTSDGFAAYRKIISLKPDVAVLDSMILKIDRSFSSEKAGTGCTLSSITQAENFIEKHLAMESLVGQIRQIKGVAFPVKNKSADVSPDNADRFNLESRIMHILHELGIMGHIRGYHYMRLAILMAVDNLEVLNQITKVLYPSIALKHGTTPIRVERAIRHAIEAAWARRLNDSVDNLFGYSINKYKGKPTNGEFIALIATGLKMEFRAEAGGERLEAGAQV